jgi:hypothetical protein
MSRRYPTQLVLLAALGALGLGIAATVIAIDAIRSVLGG